MTKEFRTKIIKIFEKIRIKNNTRREFFLVMECLIKNELKRIKKDNSPCCERVLNEILDKLDEYYFET